MPLEVKREKTQILNLVQPAQTKETHFLLQVVVILLILKLNRIQEVSQKNIKLKVLKFNQRKKKFHKEMKKRKLKSN